MENEPHAPVSASAQPLERLELAHVLFMDLVAFSTRPMEEQRRGLGELQNIVLNTAAGARGERDHLLIRLPTGDGMALVFFGDPWPVHGMRLQISSDLEAEPP